MVANMAEKESNQKYFPLFSNKNSPNVQPRVLDSKTCLKPKTSKRVNSQQLLDRQYRIDAGQKLVKIKQCFECGLLYNICDLENEKYHLRYHSNVTKIKFSGWKNERIVFEDVSTSSRIIVIDPKDSNAYWKKIPHIIEVIDRDLGLAEKKLSFYRDKKIYLYVRNKMVLGVLIPEPVTTAHRIISESNSCSTESTSVKCGILFVWTTQSHRRQGIATKLVHTLRETFLEDVMLSIDEIAFSSLISDGKAFAEMYTKTQNFKVYD